MKILKRVDVNSHNANQKVLQSPNINGIHFASYDSLPKIEEKLKKYPSTSKIILYEARQDTLCSADYLADTSSRIIDAFPNFIMDLEDAELALFVKEILKYRGQELRVATDIDRSLEGDYLLLKRKQTRRELLALLRDKRKVILNAQDYQNEMDFLENVVRTNPEDALVSTWSLKLVI